MNILGISGLVCVIGISAGCTSIPTQHGIARFYGDYTALKFDDGSVHFSATTAIHSTAVKAHWHGISNLGSEVVAGAIGLKGGNAALGMAGAVLPPVVNRPTNRATPAPKP